MVYQNFRVWLIVKLLLVGCVLSCAKPYYKPPEVSTIHSVGIKRQQAAFREKVQYQKRQVIRLVDLSFPLMRASVHFINSLGDIKRKYGFHYSSQDSWDWSKIARYNRIVIYEEYGISDSWSYPASKWSSLGLVVSSLFLMQFFIEAIGASGRQWKNCRCLMRIIPPFNIGEDGQPKLPYAYGSSDD